ncbi:hypothetical protein H920_05993 [Fukomys damarensis]|uniref:Uncharacterized protein n=1 Tax=Fukomys damarensis TaxID=885580 RepID=A0A091DNA4_FUKDA|nr:hypothetical protein H920_05993 [Fukomys damarensis]
MAIKEIYGKIYRNAQFASASVPKFGSGTEALGKILLLSLNCTSSDEKDCGHLPHTSTDAVIFPRIVKPVKFVNQEIFKNEKTSVIPRHEEIPLGSELKSKRKSRLLSEKLFHGINFYVITMNFLGAVESGFLKDAPHEIAFLARQEHRSDFCYSMEECRVFYPQAMDAARRFYEYLLSRKVSSLVDDVPVYDTDEDTVITYMWEAHQVATDVSTPKFSDISQYSSKTERDFTKDFLVAIEFCEAAKYHPYFKSAAEFLVGYPHRLLTDEDIPFVTKDSA